MKTLKEKFAHFPQLTAEEMKTVKGGISALCKFPGGRPDEILASDTEEGLWQLIEMEGAYFCEIIRN